MAEKIISEFFDLPKIKAEINEIAAEMSKKFGAAANINTLGKGAGGGNGNNSAEFEAMKKQIADLEAKIKQYNQTRQQQLTVEQKVAKQAFDSQAKWDAVANSTSKNVDSLKRLTAQMKVLESQMQREFNPALAEQSAKFRELYVEHTKLQQEYQRTARATGVMGRSMNSTYGSTFQLTQVMRELPNFAIDARIGFMALSNNLPMLADSFKQLKQQIIDTEGAAGASRKTWAAFGKSLLSLNTIMIVASTLLVLFGDKFWDFIANTKKADKAMESFLKTISKAEGEFGNAAKKMDEVNAIFDSASKGFISQKDAIEEYNKAFGSTNGYIKTFEEGQQRLIQQTPMYVQAVTMQAYANSLLEAAITTAGEAEALRRDKTVKWYQKVWEMTKVFASNESVFGGGFLNPKIMQKILDAGKDESILKKRQQEANAKDKERNDLLKQYYDEYAKFAKFSKDNKLDFWGDQNKPKKDRGTVQSGSMSNVDLRVYDKERLEIQKEMSQNEIDLQEATVDGELNSYDKRIKAAKNYFENKKYLIRLEAGDENTNLLNKFENDKKELEDKKFKNEQLYLKDKISKDRLTELNLQFNTSMRNLQDNFDVDMAEIEFKSNKEEQDALIQHNSNLLKITQDYFAAQQVLRETELAKQNAITDLETASKKNESLLGRTVKNIFGVKRNGFKDSAIDAQGSANKIQNEITSKQTDLSLNAGVYTEEQKNKILKDIADLERKKLELQIDLRQKAEDELKEISEQAQQQTVNNLIAIWGELFDYLEEKVNEKLKKDTKINDERVKQYEDETKAGLHSAEELDNFKERSVAYQTSLEEEAARKKAELDKKQFLVTQAFSLAQIWLKYAEAQQAITVASAIIAATPVVGLALSGTYAASASAWNLASAITGSALIAAQTIPAFAEGGDMPFRGKAMLGDGGKHELAISPSGKMFISDNTPKLYELEKGTHIFPDVNKVDLMSVLAMKQVMPKLGNDNAILNELRSVTNAVKSQKQGNFYGMPLIRQMNMSQRYYSRKRGLMN